MGRPSKYSDELAQTICDRIVDGQSLRNICLDNEIPARSTVDEWLGSNAAFRAKYARAREAQGDLMDEKILAVAEACQPETAAADRVKIDAFKWRASKLAPKVYGDKLDVTTAGEKLNIGSTILERRQRLERRL